jgi:hypothetical protein
MIIVAIVAAVVGFGFGFLVGNRSAKGEGAAAVATVKADASTAVTDVKKV